MNFRFLTIAISAFCFSASIVSGQITAREGYIISLDNDTIYGQLEYANSGYLNKCIFTAGDSTKLKWIKPDEIKGFYVNPDIRFSSQRYKGKYMFLDVLSEGKINLYSDRLNLYVSNNADSLIKLSGGRETYEVNGESYVRKVNTFKTQIWELTSDRRYYQRIEELNFDHEKITRLIKEINGEPTQSDRIVFSDRTIHENQFGIEAGYSFNTFFIEDISYTYGSLLIEMDSDNDFMHFFPTVTSHKANGLFAGVNYKWKIGRGNSYLSGALFFDRVSDGLEAEYGVLHSTTIMTPAEGNPYYIDTVCTVTNTYSYNLTSLGFPVLYHKEISYSRLRPWFEAGILCRINFQNEVKLNRRINFSDSPVNEEIIIHIPLYMPGVSAGVGFRYILNMDHSLSAGFNIEAVRGGAGGTSVSSLISKRTFLSFNF